MSPVDVATYPDGNAQIDLERGTWAVISKKQREDFKLGPLHKSHFATCPDKQRWLRHTS